MNKDIAAMKESVNKPYAYTPFFSCRNGLEGYFQEEGGNLKMSILYSPSLSNQRSISSI